MIDVFKDLYKQDMARYRNKPTIYVKFLLFFLRKAQTTNNGLLKFIYKLFFRLLASSRGLEISSVIKIGGGFI